MEKDRVDLLLGEEFAQEDPNFHHYAIRREDALAILRDVKRRFLIINAPRGCGKSGLLLLLEKEIRQFSSSTDTVAVKYYRNVDFPSDVGEITAAVAFWTHKLQIWLLAQIGSGIEIPETADEVLAVEWAEEMGRESHLPRGRGKPPPLSSAQSDAAILRLLTKYPRRLWLLLDEMDDLYTTSRSETLVGLLQACNSITQAIPQVTIRLTIRPHIFTYLKTHFDIVQKFRGRELDLKWELEDLLAILVQRILFFNRKGGQPSLNFELTPYPEDASEQSEKIMGEYFEDFDLSFGESGKSRYRALQTLALGRPRWMIEYCKIALELSDKDQASRIDFKKAMHDYGHNRLQFLEGEHRTQIPDLGAYVNGLTQAHKFVLGNSKDLQKLIIEQIVRISGPSGESADGEKRRALSIAQSLYMVEIIRARESAGGRDDHRFYTYDERPELLSSWNVPPKVTWEIHPTFARALNIIDNQTYKVGSTVRVFGERRRQKRARRSKR